MATTAEQYREEFVADGRPLATILVEVEERQKKCDRYEKMLGDLANEMRDERYELGRKATALKHFIVEEQVEITKGQHG